MKHDIGFEEQVMIQLEDLAKKNEYDKIVLKIPESALKVYQDNGYIYEAKISQYYNGKETCYFLSKFFTKERRTNDKQTEYENIINVAKSKTKATQRPLSQEYIIVKLDYTRADEIANLYKGVFETYPFPIFDPIYIVDTMKSHVIYFGVYYKDELVALSSSEINEEYKNVEMTDFAIKPTHRGKQLAKHLLLQMEQEMIKMDLRTLYTIARAESMPMNCTFSSLGYHFGGTLINNTQIAGKIESMNIWYKNR